jgi:hypothetical protein
MVPRPQRTTPSGRFVVSESSQDLYFFGRLRELGYRVACDTRVKVGHYDVSTGVVW